LSGFRVRGSGSMLRLEEITVGGTLRSVSLTVGEREMVAVWGTRQSGRAILLRVAAGLQRPDAGRVSAEGLVTLVTDVWPPMGGATVVDQLALPLLGQGAPVSRSRAVAVRWLLDHHLEEWVALDLVDLDAWERAYLAVFRALIVHPALVLIDDPTAAGTVLQQDAVVGLLRGAPAKGSSVLVTTGDTGVLAAADRILMLTQGELRESPPPTAQVIEFPRVRDVG
jgi:ABC-type lipoprotein export system ATPase subunit